MERSRTGFARSTVAMVLILTGCAGARVMMPTPNLHLDPNRDFYGELRRELKNTEVPLFYVTDRAPEENDGGELRYGSGRSASLGFGSAVVDLGVDITWEELLEASRVQRRLRPVTLELREVTEIARGPAIPVPFKEVDGRIVEEPGLAAQRAESKEAFRRVLVRQLELTPRKEVFIFVHGYHNRFADAAFAMAELWHFLGRIGVPIVYTWPAGYPGLFGYTYDRESSEFTIYHFRSLLRLIASYPEVERIHLIAHSRGTDVAVAAVRELTIAARAAGLDPREEYKIHNLVLSSAGSGPGGRDAADPRRQDLVERESLDGLLLSRGRGHRRRQQALCEPPRSPRHIRAGSADRCDPGPGRIQHRERRLRQLQGFCRSVVFW